MLPEIAMPPVKWCGAACECGNWSRGRFANRGGACISGVRISHVCITQCDPRKTGRAFYRLAGRTMLFSLADLERRGAWVDWYQPGSNDENSPARRFYRLANVRSCGLG